MQNIKILFSEYNKTVQFRKVGQTMAFSLHGVKVPHRKNTANNPAVKINTPETVILPTAMHIGAPATPVVKPGDHVDIGTLVAAQNGAVSSPVYASVSGTVKKIEDFLTSAGKYVPAVVIESDGADTVAEVTPPVVDSKESFIEAIKQSGLVGLGGAGFPTYLKFATDKPIEYLIINGTECEPYITSDTRTMIDDADSIADAINIIDKYFNLKEYIIGIENNKKEAIAKMNEIAAKNSKVRVKVLPSRYPQGGEKVLIFNTTGKVVKAGCLPADVGCLVFNCTTMAYISRYIKTGMPIVAKTVTVDGGAVKKPKNVTVPLGTPIKNLFDFCGGLVKEPSKVLYGGPMMGITVPSLDAPVLKQTNAVLALTEKETRMPAQTSCIRCGTCANTCPLGIDPAAITINYEAGNIEALGKLGIQVCMECGCCSFNCPACRPLVQTNKLAKAAYKDFTDKNKEEKK